MTILKLTPRKRKKDKYIDYVEISDKDDIPSAIVHIDVFWEGHGGRNLVHNALNAGQEIIVELTIVEDKD